VNKSGGVVGLLAMLAAGVAVGQTQRPSVASVPLEVSAHPSLKKVEAELKTGWFEALRDSGLVIQPTRKEAEAAAVAGKRQDCRESNECLTQFAARLGTLYALYIETSYSELKVVSVNARVVRDDGKVMGTSSVQREKGKETIVEVSKKLFVQVIEQLGLAGLPSFKEVAPTKVEPTVDPVKRVEIKEPPPPLPPIVPVDTGKGLRSAGTALLVGGASLALVGGVVSGVGCAVGCAVKPDANGYLSSAEAQSAATGRTLMTAGFVGVGVGVGVAAVGAVLMAVAGPVPGSSVSMVPVSGGAVVQFGGRF
jgi:hypothetical protein